MIPSRFTNDKTEFEAILKNEQTEVKGNIKTQIASTGLFPTFGRINLIYTTIILINQIIISMLIPFKLVFMEQNEKWGYVYYDLVIDFIFFLDILIHFNMPIYSKGRFITDRKQIAMNYIKTWFILDLLCCIPFSWIRKNSEDWPRGSNDMENFINFNFNALPRFYPMMVLPKMLVRMRTIGDNMQKVLKRAAWMAVQVQNIIIVLYWLIFTMNFIACLLRGGANFNLNDPDNWVNGDGLYTESTFT